MQSWVSIYYYQWDYDSGDWKHTKTEGPGSQDQVVVGDNNQQGGVVFDGKCICPPH